MFATTAEFLQAVHSQVGETQKHRLMSFAPNDDDENLTEQRLGDGSAVCTDMDGNVRRIRYCDGLMIRRNSQSVIVRRPDGNFFFSSPRGFWFILD